MEIIWNLTRISDNLTNTMPYCECYFCLECKSKKSPDYYIDTTYVAEFALFKCILCKLMSNLATKSWILHRSEHLSDTCHVRMIIYRPN